MPVLPYFFLPVIVSFSLSPDSPPRFNSPKHFACLFDYGYLLKSNYKTFVINMSSQNNRSS